MCAAYKSRSITAARSLVVICSANTRDRPALLLWETAADAVGKEKSRSSIWITLASCTVGWSLRHRHSLLTCGVRMNDYGKNLQREREPFVRDLEARGLRYTRRVGEAPSRKRSTPAFVQIELLFTFRPAQKQSLAQSPAYTPVFGGFLRGAIGHRDLRPMVRSLEWLTAMTFKDGYLNTEMTFQVYFGLF